MILQQLIAAVKAKVAIGHYRFLNRGEHPALLSLPPGLWLYPATHDPTDVIHWVPPWPVHPLEAVASKGCYGAVTGEHPTREQCEALMVTRGRFAVAMNVWGRALGVEPRVAAAWFFAFTPLGVPRRVPRRAGLCLLSEQVWTDLGFGVDAARAAAFEAGERADPPTRRDTFWEPQHVEYPADVDRVYLDRVAAVETPQPHDS